MYLHNIISFWVNSIIQHRSVLNSYLLRQPLLPQISLHVFELVEIFEYFSAPKDKVLFVLSIGPYRNCKFQDFMLHGYNIWDLDLFAELRDQLINLNIVLVCILWKIANHASSSFRFKVFKLLEYRICASVAYTYNVYLKTDTFCIQCLLELRVIPLESGSVIISIGYEVDIRISNAVFFDLPHHLL